MSKISVIVICLFSLGSWAKVNMTLARIHVEDGQFFVNAKDKKGFIRDYLITNSSDYIYDCIRLQNKLSKISGEFKDHGVRTGTVKITDIGQEEPDLFK